MKEIDSYFCRVNSGTISAATVGRSRITNGYRSELESLQMGRMLVCAYAPVKGAAGEAARRGVMLKQIVCHIRDKRGRTLGA
jgi:hypothetical protein